MEQHNIATKLRWVKGVDYPVWGDNALYLTTIKGSYLLPGEKPVEAYRRISKAAASNLKGMEIEGLEDKFFNIFWKGWLIPSTPVMVNLGTERGLPISCFSGVVGDSMYDIGRKNLEIMMLSKHGGGTALDYSPVREIGSLIMGGLNGTSDGIVPFIKMNDSAILASKQGKARRGALAIYLNAKHKEFESFLDIRESKGDVNRQCHNLHQGATFEDEFMEAVESKDGKERALWKKTLMKRVKTGEPYTFFIDNANKTVPQFWKDLGLKIRQSNLCAEIMEPTDENHTLVCCLSSLNLVKFDEWKDTETVYLSTLFLDGVMQEFIDKAKSIPGIEDAVRFAEKARALGLGALGWHSYLQSKMLPFIGIQSNSLTRLIFGHIEKESIRATKDMAVKLGEPLWCKGQGIRNLCRMAVAPNRSSAKLAGGKSQGVEPLSANLYVDDDSKGVHIRRNEYLEELLESKGMNIPQVWDRIAQDKGSVANIDCLTDYEKEVFLTFKEINQLELVRQAAIRQKYIDQGQSINLAFFKDAPAKFINKVHMEAWKLGLKSLYYFRSESNLRADSKQQRDLYSECIMCEG